MCGAATLAIVERLKRAAGTPPSSGALRRWHVTRAHELDHLVELVRAPVGIVAAEEHRGVVGAVEDDVAMEADAGTQPLEGAAAEQWRAARMEALAGADQRHRAGDAPQLGRGGCGGIGEEDVLA